MDQRTRSRHSGPGDKTQSGNQLRLRFVPITMYRTILLAALLFIPSFSYPCTCGGPDPICSAYWRTPVVFRGRVLEETLLGRTVQPVTNLDGSSSTIESSGYRRVRFLVLER